METLIRDRYTKPLKRDGFQFRDSDLEICKLFAPGSKYRQPWGYRYLPTSYIFRLLGRGTHPRTSRERLEDLRAYDYIDLPEAFVFGEPLSRQFVWELGREGIAELELDGFPVRLSRDSEPHKLLESITFASIEMASSEFNEPIVVPTQPDVPFRPDGPFFRMFGYFAAVEIDMGTEQQDRKIYEKICNFLKLIHTGQFKDLMVVFILSRPGRYLEASKQLKIAIDNNNYPHRYAKQFGFLKYEWKTKKGAVRHFTRHVTHIPPLTSWFATSQYLRVGNIPPFTFRGGERGREAEAHQGTESTAHPN
ncbi:hypothetical protein JJE66_33865 [Bradyrhizobium diazoefficiens]|uniref:replication-relaxation family protein n=1 Tax=Bradyrhizobium diazoefficiens TaxID=1355477 RepID=UPI001909CDD4|nr:replication-relaxation family protein [Bradyrhizobium diazoefficiens]MBK3666196.1 hypothetical protein [Bradyrhizobium diazoefficiens]